MNFIKHVCILFACLFLLQSKIFAGSVSNVTDSSAVIISTNNVPDEMDRSAVIVSAIKSISGEKPANEFFDINLKFRFYPAISLPFIGQIIDNLGCMTNASFDLALSNVSTDTVGGVDKKLSEAGLLIDFGVKNSGPRTFLTGGTFKIFNGIPYAGLHIGGMELKNSDLPSSYVCFSFLWRLAVMAQGDQTSDGVPQSFQNFYLEFGLYSTNKSFGLLNSLRVKGGILMPLKNGETTGIISRIVIEVPIDGIHYF